MWQQMGKKNYKPSKGPKYKYLNKNKEKKGKWKEG